MTDIPSHQLEPRATFNTPESLRTPGQDVVEKAIKDITALEKVVAQELELPEGTSELSKATDELLADVAEGAIKNEREHPGAETHAAALARVEDAIIRTGLEASAHHPDMKTSPAIILELGDHGDRIDQAMTDLASVHAQTPKGEDLTKLVAQQIDALPHTEATGNETIVIPVTSEADAAEVVGYNPGKEVKLYDGRNEHRFGIRGELSPFERREFTLPDGTRRTANVLAEITAASSPHTFVLAERMGQFAGITTNEDGTIKVDPMLSNHMTFHDSNQLYTVERLDIGKDGLSWRFFQSGWEKRNVAIKLSDNAEVVDRPKTTSEIARNIERKKENRKGAFKKLLATAAIGATLHVGLMPGGAIDKVVERTINIEQIVGGEDEESVGHYTMDDELDGIPIRDYPEPEKMLIELNNDIDKNNAEYKNIEQSVEGTLRDLKNHNYDAIRQRAQEYKDQHPDELMSDGRANELRQQIAQASTPEEIQMAMSELGNFYGVEVICDREPSVMGEEVTLNDMRFTAEGVFNALSSMPKILVEKSKLRKVFLEEPKTLQKGKQSTADGAYGSDKIYVRYKSQLNDKLQRLDAYSVKTVFLHEFGHALSYNSSMYVRDTSMSMSSTSEAFDFIMNRIIRYPQSISTYARTDPNENSAELTSAVIGDRPDGLASPDDARRFISPVNKKIIEGLIRLEYTQRGLTDYFVSMNQNVMDK